MSSSLPYLGSKISLLTLADIRYEGILYTINTEESTIALQNVRSFGTEGRRTPGAPASDEVYEYIIFRGKDIKDLTVLDEAPRSPRAAVLADPAIVTVNNKPPAPSSSFPSRQQQQQQPRDHQGQYQPQPRPGSSSYRRDDRRGEFPPQQRPFSRPAYGDHPQRGGFQGHGGARPQSGNFGGRGGYDSGRGAHPQSRGGHQRGGHGYGGGRYGRQQQQGQPPIGELPANENAVTKAEVKEDFDFSSSNAGFEKPETATTETTVREGYNKTKSFFDDISCDALDRGAQGGARRQDPNVREKMRATDRETFGATTVSRGGGSHFHGRRY